MLISDLSSDVCSSDLVASALGVGMILAWGSSFSLLAVLAGPIAADTGWPLSWIVGALSIGFLTSGLVSPQVGRAIERWGGRPVLAFGAVVMSLGLFALALAQIGRASCRERVCQYV